jgi:ESS family glutamate:Na+ symporter
MLLANVLRRKIPFLRKSMMPTAVIAGLIGLLLRETVRWATGFDLFDAATLDGLVYHLLSIGFIALCLREKDDYEKEFDKSEAKPARGRALKTGGFIVASYLMQALVGIAVTVFLAFTFMPELNSAVGIMLPLGFGQGPGQAGNTGGIWDAINVFEDWGIAGVGRNFGLAVAAMGFIWASIPGIFLVNRIAKRKGLKLHTDQNPTSSRVGSQMIEGPDEVPLSESIDKFSLQLCMVMGVYFVTIGVIIGIEALLNLAGQRSLVATVWGFSFIVAVVLALLTKAILRKLRKSNIMHRKYPNSYMMNRISGAAFDISITAALCAISFSLLGSLWVPLLIMSTLGGVATIFFVRWLADRLYPDYKDEAFLGMYGMMTGTISNGMILLREIDPDYKTNASTDLVAGSGTGIIFGFPLLILIAQAPLDNNVWWVTAVIAAYLGVLLLYLTGILGRIFIRKKPMSVAGFAEAVAAASDEALSGAENGGLGDDEAGE